MGFYLFILVLVIMLIFVIGMMIFEVKPYERKKLNKPDIKRLPIEILYDKKKSIVTISTEKYGSKVYNISDFIELTRKDYFKTIVNKKTY